MLSARLGLVALSMISATHVALAQSSAPDDIAPIGSPADWIGANDYPTDALRFEMEGTTAYQLTLDATGKPAHCEVVTSSGFDALDTATCERLMAKAEFTPARDRKGKAIEGAFSGRVNWIIPRGEKAPVAEHFASIVLSIDQSGKVTSCKIVIRVPVNAASFDQECEAILSLPPSVGLEFRGNTQSPSATVEVRMANVFTPELRTQVLAPMQGYEQRGLSVHRFTVTDGGKLGTCNYIEHRGSIYVASNFCRDARDAYFDPPFTAFDKDGVANGYRIMSVLLKSDE